MPDQLSLTQQGIKEYRAGHKAAALDLLKRAIAHDPKDATAWLWLSGLLDAPEEKRRCLEKALEIQPDLDVARQALAKLPPTQETDIPTLDEIAPARPQVIPAGMKECFQCKSIIPAAALTCPKCGKDPSKAAATSKALQQVGCSLITLPFQIGLLILTIIIFIALLKSCM